MAEIREAKPLTAAMLTQQAQGEQSPAEPIAERVEEAADLIEGRDDAEHGEVTTLESAKAEIDSAELVVDVNSRLAALKPLLSEDDADELALHAASRIAEMETR
jgi:hypothetical protein